MIVTQRDAERLICPFAKIRGPQFSQIDPPTCVGSRCMAWVWVRVEETLTDGEPASTWPDLAVYLGRENTKLYRRFGGCGIAGAKHCGVPGA